MRLNDPTDPTALSAKFRAKRAVALRRLLLNSGRRILDLGGTSDYWQRIGLDFLREHGFSITILNYTASELGEGPFTSIVGDACAVDAADMSYDFVHSNSVVEHVGSWERMQMFAGEVRRLAPAYYVQTPNWWFPIEPHFYTAPMFHWLPVSIRAQILYRFPVAHAGRIRPLHAARKVVNETTLLTARQMSQLFPDATITKERVAGLPKSLIAVRTAAAAA